MRPRITPRWGPTHGLVYYTARDHQITILSYFSALVSKYLAERYSYKQTHLLKIKCSVVRFYFQFCLKEECRKVGKVTTFYLVKWLDALYSVRSIMQIIKNRAIHFLNKRNYRLWTHYFCLSKYIQLVLFSKGICPVGNFSFHFFSKSSAACGFVFASVFF